MFLNTLTVESDILLIGAEKNVYGQSVTDLLLEGILHAKQFGTLRSMSTWQTPFGFSYIQYTAIFNFPPYPTIKTLFDTTISLIVIVLGYRTIKSGLDMTLQKAHDAVRGLFFKKNFFSW